jgi:hypothetical protein
MKRIGLVILALSSGPIGLWATVAPRSFYDNFPGTGTDWIRLDGPYNHHLITDFGGLNLALFAVTVAALIWMTPPMIGTAAVAWLAYGIPHFVYHAGHLDPFDTVDKVGQLAGIGANIVIALLLLVAVTRGTRNRRANSS